MTAIRSTDNRGTARGAGEMLGEGAVDVARPAAKRPRRAEKALIEGGGVNSTDEVTGRLEGIELDAIYFSMMADIDFDTSLDAKKAAAIHCACAGYVTGKVDWYRIALTYTNDVYAFKEQLTAEEIFGIWATRLNCFLMLTEDKDLKERVTTLEEEAEDTEYGDSVKLGIAFCIRKWNPVKAWELLHEVSERAPELIDEHSVLVHAIKCEDIHASTREGLDLESEDGLCRCFSVETYEADRANNIFGYLEETLGGIEEEIEVNTKLAMKRFIALCKIMSENFPTLREEYAEAYADYSYKLKILHCALLNAYAEVKMSESSLEEAKVLVRQAIQLENKLLEKHTGNMERLNPVFHTMTQSQVILVRISTKETGHPTATETQVDNLLRAHPEQMDVLLLAAEAYINLRIESKWSTVWMKILERKNELTAKQKVIFNSVERIYIGLLDPVSKVEYGHLFLEDDLHKAVEITHGINSSDLSENEAVLAKFLEINSKFSDSYLVS